MKTLLIGHNNSIAKKLTESMTNEFTFTHLTNQYSLPWRFGDQINLSDFEEADRIIFLAWSKSDLDLSLNALKLVLKSNKNLKSPVNFLFISSYSIFNCTRYGVSKLFGEELVKSFGGQFIRTPLIYDNVETYELKKLIKTIKLFRFMPSNNVWGGTFEIMKLDSLIEEISSWIKGPDAFPSPGFNETKMNPVSIRDFFMLLNITDLKTSYFVDFGTKILQVFILFWGSKSRKLDSIVSFYPHNDEYVKQRYHDLHL